MFLEKRSSDSVIVLEMLETRLDALAAAEFRECLHSLIRESDASMIVNLQRIEFIDSSGIGAFVSGRKRLDPGREIALCAAAEPIQRLFRLTRIDNLFRVFSTEAEAVAALSAGFPANGSQPFDLG